jgi:putative endonuclease
MKNYFVYILCSKRNGTLYIGVTSDLNRRVQEHKAKLIPGFTKKYSITYLVYFEAFDSAMGAIHREKCLKEWPRAWKLQLIDETNPTWLDLFTSEPID